ncbi:MAG: hypothetical protein IT184_16300 [Acidobacteria bacterium]|nr:hypothetical protein [Acidobacteriota bacterium]
MTRNVKQRYEMFLKVRDFGVMHRAWFPDASPAGKAFAALTAAVGEVDAITTGTAIAEAADKKTRAELRDAIVSRLKTIARTARLAKKTSPDADLAFALPVRQADDALVAAARQFVKKAEQVQELLQHLGVAVNVFTELPVLIDRLQRAIDGRRKDKDGRATAQEGIRNAMTHALDAVRTLDVLVVNVLEHDPVRLAAWKRSRRVTPKTRSQGDPVATDTTAAPPAPPTPPKNDAPPVPPVPPAPPKNDATLPKAS